MLKKTPPGGGKRSQIGAHPKAEGKRPRFEGKPPFQEAKKKNPKNPFFGGKGGRKTALLLAAPPSSSACSTWGQNATLTPPPLPPHCPPPQTAHSIPSQPPRPLGLGSKPTSIASPPPPSRTQTPIPAPNPPPSPESPTQASLLGPNPTILAPLFLLQPHYKAMGGGGGAGRSRRGVAGDRKSRPQCGRERRRGRGRKGAEVPPTSAHHVVLRWRGGAHKEAFIEQRQTEPVLKAAGAGVGWGGPRNGV